MARAAGANQRPLYPRRSSMWAPPTGMPYVVSRAAGSGDAGGPPCGGAPLTVRGERPIRHPDRAGPVLVRTRKDRPPRPQPDNVFLHPSGAGSSCSASACQAHPRSKRRTIGSPSPPPSSSGERPSMGTPATSLPGDGWEGQPTDRRVDLFALGAILYRMRAGRARVRAASGRRARHEPRPSLGRDRRRSTSMGWRCRATRSVVVWRCLEKSAGGSASRTAHEVRLRPA
jgi:hypothetical protein